MLTFSAFLRARASARAYVRLELAFMAVCGGDPSMALLLSHVVDLATVYAGQEAPMPALEACRATGLSEKRVSTALRNLRQLGLVEARTRCLPGTTRRMLHVRVRTQPFLQAWQKATAGEQNPQSGFCCEGCGITDLSGRKA